MVVASRGPDFQRTASSEWRGGRRALGSRADSYEAGPGGWNAAQRADSVARMWLPEGAVRVGRPTGPKEGWQHAASSAQSRSVRPASYYHKMPCRSGSMPPRRAGERGVGRRRRACADEQGDGCPALNGRPEAGRLYAAVALPGRIAGPAALAMPPTPPAGVARCPPSRLRVAGAQPGFQLRT